MKKEKSKLSIRQQEEKLRKRLVNLGWIVEPDCKSLRPSLNLVICLCDGWFSVSEAEIIQAALSHYYQ